MEASTIGRKTSVNKTTGQVSIADGTQGNGKILTSDADGNSSWKSAEESNMPVLQIRAYNPNILQPTGLTYVPPIPVVGTPRPNYNPANGSFTVTEAGFYEHNLSFDVYGPVFNLLFSTQTSIKIEDGLIRGNTSTTWNPRNVNGVKWFNVGDVMTINFFLQGNNTFTSAYKIRNISLVIFKR